MADAKSTPDFNDLLADAPASASDTTAEASVSSDTPAPEAAAADALAALASTDAPSVRPAAPAPEAVDASLDEQLREAAAAVKDAEAALEAARGHYAALSSRVAAIQQKPLSLHELNQLSRAAARADEVKRAESLEALRKMGVDPAALGLATGARAPRRAPHPPLFPTSAPVA